MTRAEAIEFLVLNKGRKVRSWTNDVYEWDRRRGVIFGDLRQTGLMPYDGGYEPVPEAPVLPVNFPPNWEPVETREEAEYMGGGRVAYWSHVAQKVMADPALMLSGDNFYVRVKR